MPYRPKSYNNTSSGYKEYKPDASTYNKGYNRKREVEMPHHKVYSTKEWKQLRAELRKDHCELCGSEFNLKLHHLIPIDEDPSLALEPSNLQTVCARCHLQIHADRNKLRQEKEDGM